MKFCSQSLQAPVTAFQELSKLLILGSLGPLSLQGDCSLQNVIPLVKNLLLTSNFQSIQEKLRLFILVPASSVFTQRSFPFLAFIPEMYLQPLMGFSPLSAFICQQKQVKLHQSPSSEQNYSQYYSQSCSTSCILPSSITCMILMKQTMMSSCYSHRCHCDSLLSSYIQILCPYSSQSVLP